LLLFVFDTNYSLGAEETASLENQKTVTPKVVGPEDEYGRGVPSSSFKGYSAAASEKDYTRAAEYLDLRNLPRDVRNIGGEKLAEMFRDILNRALWVDTDMLSDHPDGYADDGLPPYRDLLGQIEADKKTYNLLLQKVPRGDGVHIWKVSNKTVAIIPELHELLGYGPFGDALDAIFPDIEIFGTKLWQWAGLIIILVGAYIAAILITSLAAPIVRRNLSPEMAKRILPFIKGPLRFLIWIMLAWSMEGHISPTVTLRMLMKGGTLILIAFAWTLISLVDFYFIYLQQKFENEDRLGALVLLKPARTVVRILIVVIAFLAWLDNIGFQVTTLLAGLGVGGIAIALAAQAILADFIAAIILLMAQPVRVGDFCRFGNTLGIVEDIGLRATRIRTLDNTVVSVPNAEFSKQHIENYALREKVWFHPKVKLPYETSKDTIRKIAEGIEEMLKNHPEVHNEPIQVYFTEIGDYSHNIDVFSYVATGDYGKYKKIAHELNNSIMEIVEKAGARLALPSRKMYMEEGKPDSVDNEV
jgi:MscS family membrane protein